MKALPEEYTAVDVAMLDWLMGTRAPQACTCYTEMGNDFWFLPIGSCLHGKCDKQPVSPTVAAFDARAALERESPLLALAYLVEAVGDRRAGQGADPWSQLGTLRDAAVRAIEAAGQPRRPELYPDRKAKEGTATRQGS